MPRLDEYNNTQNVNPGVVDETARSVAAYGRQAGSDIDRGASAIGNAFNQLGEAAGQNETMALAKKASDTDLQLDTEYADLKQNTDPNDPASMEKLSNFYTDNVQPAYDKLGADLGSKQAREYFQAHSISRQDEFGRRILTDHYQLAGDAAVSNFQDLVDNGGKRVELDPSNLHDVLGSIQRAGTALPPSVRDRAVREATNHTADFTAETLFNRAVHDPNATPQSLDAAYGMISNPDGELFKSMSPGRLATIQDEFDKAKAGVASTQFAGVAAQWDDMRAAVRAGNPAAISWTQQNLNNVMGSTPKEKAEEIAKRQQGFADDQAYAKQATAFVGKTLPELKQMSDTILPPDAERSAADKGNAASQEVAKNMVRAYDSDRTGYMLQNNVAVGTAYQQFQQNPNAQTFQNYAAKTTAAQNQFDPDNPPAIVTAQMHNDIASALQTVAQSPEGAAQAAGTIQSYAKLAGPYWGQMYHELYASHTLSAPQYVAAGLYANQQTAALGQEVLRAAAVPEKEMNTSAKLAEGSALKLARDALAPLASTLNGTVNGADLMNAQITAMADVLRLRSVMGNAPTAQDATNLANQMILGKFNIAGGLRIPTNYDSGDVVNGTTHLMANLDTMSLVVPKTYGALKGPDKQYASDVKDFGYWTTNSQGNGAVLMSQDGVPVQQMVGGKPANVSISFNDLAAQGKQNRSVLNKVERFVTNPGSL